MPKFDETKVRRSDDGQFAEKPAAAESGLDLDGVPAPGFCPDCGAQTVTEPDGETLHVAADGSTSTSHAEPEPDEPGKPEPGTSKMSEADRLAPGAPILDERPFDSARDTLIGAGHSEESVDEALSYLTPKRRYDDDGEPYESLNDDQMGRAEEMLEGRAMWSHLHDCRECGKQMDGSASPNVKGTCMECTGEWESEDADMYGIKDPPEEVLGSRFLDRWREGYGQVADDVAAEHFPRLRSVTDGQSTDVVLTTADQDAFDEECQRRAHGTTPELDEGSRSPWGPVQQSEALGRGAVAVSTAGHGGIKLSKERNAAIPQALRNRSGWYEEDAEANVVAMYHPGLFARDDQDPRDVAAKAALSVRNWQPDGYSAATGRSVAPEQSYTLRRRVEAADSARFRAAHANEFVSTGWGSDSTGSWVPQGMSVVSARVDATGEERSFLVPHDEAVADHRIRSNILVDPRRHVDVTDISTLGNPPRREERPVLTGSSLGLDTSRLSPTARDRARSELGTRYRYPDGVRTFGEELARSGVVGKRTVAYGNTTGTSYTLQTDNDGHVRTVTKATYDALGGVPDVTSEVDRAGVAVRNAERRNARASRADGERTRAELAAATRALREAQAAEDATKVPWEERQRMRREAIAERLGAES